MGGGDAEKKKFGGRDSFDWSVRVHKKKNQFFIILVTAPSELQDISFSVHQSCRFCRHWCRDHNIKYDPILQHNIYFHEQNARNRLSEIMMRFCKCALSTSKINLLNLWAY